MRVLRQLFWQGCREAPRLLYTGLNTVTALHVVRRWLKCEWLLVRVSPLRNHDILLHLFPLFYLLSHTAFSLWWPFPTSVFLSFLASVLAPNSSSLSFTGQVKSPGKPSSGECWSFSSLYVVFVLIRFGLWLWLSRPLLLSHCGW